MAVRTRRLLEASIRPFREDDEAFVVALGGQLFRPYLRRVAASMRSTLASRASDVALAVHGDTRLGFVIVEIEGLGRDFGPIKRPRVAHLDAIAVQPNLASQGLGRRLLSHAEARARANGAVSISLLTAETNVAAQRLFLGAGYQMLARIDDVYDGEQAAYSMFKSLARVRA